jgi:hypothetical protein
VENHEFCIVALEQTLQELHADASEALSVGNHNFLDSACTDGVQKGEKPGTLPVEAAPDVGDELVSKSGCGEISTLPLETGAPMMGADAGVAEETLRFRFRGIGAGDTEETLDIGPMIEAFAGPGFSAHGLYLALFSPEAKSARADILRLTDGGGRYVLVLQFEKVGANEGCEVWK